jgi:pimeloyl-ACP methyl ester carboxylesterase
MYQKIAGDRDRRAFPPPGKFVMVNAARMHLHCTGQGSPTVVLDSGLSDAWIAWYKVQPQVARFTQVCSYDRAGLGWSEPNSRPRTSSFIAQDLHALLHNAGLVPPFVVVGHSMGGLDVRMYAKLYPSEVAGMVLVDASHPEQFDRFPRDVRASGGEWRRAVLRVERLMPFGIPRLMDWCGTAQFSEVRDEFRAFDCTTQQKLGTIAEIDAFNGSLAEARTAGSLGDLPLVVLSEDPDRPSPGGPEPAFHRAWLVMQEELAHLSTRGSHVIAKGAGHQIHLERPDLVIGAIAKVVSEARAAASTAMPASHR